MKLPRLRISEIAAEYGVIEQALRFAKNKGICYSKKYHIISFFFVSRLKHFNDQKGKKNIPKRAKR